MLYQEFSPSSLLQPFIKCFWVLENEYSNPEDKERVLPDGSMELIFHYGDRFQEAGAVQAGAFVYGQLHQAIDISPTGKTGILGIRFYPNGLSPFTHIPGKEISNRPAIFRELFHLAGEEIKDQLMNCTTTEQRINLMTNFLEKQLLSHGHRFDDMSNWCVQQIITLQGQSSKHDLLQHVGLSQRQLERRFKDAVGLTIKHFSRIIRFQHTLKLMQSSKSYTLTSLAHHAGYYDQAHFIKDFREFSGVNPKTYITQEHKLSDLLINGE